VQGNLQETYYRTFERFFLLQYIDYVPVLKSSEKPKLHCTSEKIYFHCTKNICVKFIRTINVKKRFLYVK